MSDNIVYADGQSSDFVTSDTQVSTLLTIAHRRIQLSSAPPSNLIKQYSANDGIGSSGADGSIVSGEPAGLSVFGGLSGYSTTPIAPQLAEVASGDYSFVNRGSVSVISSGLSVTNTSLRSTDITATYGTLTDSSVTMPNMQIKGAFDVNTATIFMETAFNFWKDGTTIDGVTCLLDSIGTTDASGNLTLIAPDKTIHTLNASKPADQAVTDAVMTNDALAALKIAVGLSPNADSSAASNYQLLAADVNNDGKVTASDALGILRMAVKLSSAPGQEWLFVPQSVAGEEMNRTSVHRPLTTTSVTINSDHEVNLVGIVLGDVNGSWAA
jgi:hypothetical protein